MIINMSEGASDQEIQHVVDERAVVRRKCDGPSLRFVSIGATDGDRSVPGIPVEMSTHPAAN